MCIIMRVSFKDGREKETNGVKESEYFEQLCSGALKFHYEPLDKCAASVEMLSGPRTAKWLHESVLMLQQVFHAVLA